VKRAPLGGEGLIPSNDSSTASRSTYVVVGEVTALEHELGDDTVEAGALVTEALLAGAKSTEVGSGAGNLVVEELEDNAARNRLAGEGKLEVDVRHDVWYIIVCSGWKGGGEEEEKVEGGVS